MIAPPDVGGYGDILGVESNRGRHRRCVRKWRYENPAAWAKTGHFDPNQATTVPTIPQPL